MNPILRNILVLIAAIFVGGLVNMGIIMIGSSIIPPPEGVDPTNLDDMNAKMHLYEAKHFIMPFLAHALGTLVAGFIAAKFAASQNLRLAILTGFFFLIGGIMMTRMLDAPTWFDALDLLVAYLPMGWLGWKLSGSNRGH